MASTRSLRILRPLGLPCYYSSSSSKNCHFPSMVSTKIRCSISSGNGFVTANWPSSTTTNTRPLPTGHVEVRTAKDVKATVSTSGCVVTSKPKMDIRMHLAMLLSDVSHFVVILLRRFNLFIRRTPWNFHIQMFVEKVIMDCRFFTIFAVGGSLLGSLLCFVEGCFLIAESYLQYFHSLSQGSEQDHLVHLLIEAIDMFLVATAMLVFGMGMHVMFVGSSGLRGGKGSKLLHRSNILKTLASRVGMETIMQAKSKIGQAVVMILQVGVLEKFKTIPVVTGFDLACFAGAVFTSSACMFLLSKIAVRDPLRR